MGGAPGFCTNVVNCPSSSIDEERNDNSCSGKFNICCQNTDTIVNEIGQEKISSIEQAAFAKKRKEQLDDTEPYTIADLDDILKQINELDEDDDYDEFNLGVKSGSSSSCNSQDFRSEPSQM